MKKLYVFLLLSTAFSIGLKAQSPGGVSTNLSMWLRADAPATLSPATGSLNGWQYFNSTNAFAATAGSQPTVAPATFNFLPSISFNGSQMMAGPSGPGATGAPIPAGSLAYSVFAVWESSAPSSSPNQRIWSQRPASNAPDGNFDGASLWIFNGQQYGDQPEVAPFTTGLGLTYTPGVQYISQMNFLNQNTNDLELVDQTNFATGPLVLSTDPSNNATVDRVLTDAANYLGARSTFLDEPFIGNLAEVIVYSGPVSGAARNQVFSYLSLKYGIPLGNANLVSSTGTTIWDATANSAYNNSVFGIGQDNGSGLSNSISNSISTGTGNGTGQSGLGNIILSGTLAADQSFLVVGNDNGALTETASNVPVIAAGSTRLVRNWKVQNTNAVSQNNLSFDLTGITTTGVIGTTSDFRIIVDEAGDPTFATGTVDVAAPTSFSGNIANFTGLTFPSGSVFAIITKASVITPLPVNWLGFTAKAVGNDVDLNWQVAANQNAKVYEVQHSTDGKSFTTIGEVANEPDVTSYSFAHVNAGPGNHYYRIQEIDLDGKSIYSIIVSATIHGSDFAIRALNNPVVGNATAEIEIDAVTPGNTNIEIWTLDGKRISAQQQFVSSGVNKFSLPINSLASGTYIVNVSVNNGGKQSVQFVRL